MSLASSTGAAAAGRESFSGRTILTLILVGLVAFAGFFVLAAYAPDLRAGANGGANALSSSAVGYRGAAIMLRAMDTPVQVLRTRPDRRRLTGAGVVLTPQPGVTAAQLRPFAGALRTL